MTTTTMMAEKAAKSKTLRRSDPGLVRGVGGRSHGYVLLGRIIEMSVVHPLFGKRAK
jgi:hypothetical protein